MAGAQSLTFAEIGMIKTMFTISPALSNQAILSYFTRPGRDLNHRVIAEIKGGVRFGHVAAASLAATLTYMQACEATHLPTASTFLGPSAIDEDGTLADLFGALRLHWWPVGQGLFQSGRLELHDRLGFVWVYDCGSSSSTAVRDRAIRRFRAESDARRIDLVAISHFDEDHINGIEALLRGTHVRTLLLPYLPLWQRLLAAVRQGITAGNPRLEFYLDPVTYLAGIEGSEIGEILLVQPTGPDDLVDPGAGEPGPERGPGEAKIDYGDRPDDADDNLVPRSANGVSIAYLRRAGRILIPGLWEFVPYNDAELRPRVDQLFLTQVTWIVRRLLRRRPHRGLALALLKRLYDRQFGDDPHPRNLASLFLYSGPVGVRIGMRQHIATHAVRWNAARDNFAQLATGDGYLDSPARLAALRHFFGSTRIKRAGIVQVMHHGASANWHEGVAAALAPAVSIFSSDPAHKGYRHPHPEVLRDFWPWCPVQVDRERGFELVVWLT